MSTKSSTELRPVTLPLGSVVTMDGSVPFKLQFRFSYNSHSKRFSVTHLFLLLKFTSAVPDIPVAARNTFTRNHIGTRLLIGSETAATTEYSSHFAFSLSLCPLRFRSQRYFLACCLQRFPPLDASCITTFLLLKVFLY